MNINSEKGNKIFEELKEKMTSEEVNYDLACSFNHYHNVVEHVNRNKFFKGISNGSINENNIIEYMNKYSKKPLYKRVLGKGKKIIKKIIKK